MTSWTVSQAGDSRLTHSAAPIAVLEGRCRAPLRVNPEPLGCARGLEFVERQTLAFMPGVDGLTSHFSLLYLKIGLYLSLR